MKKLLLMLALVASTVARASTSPAQVTFTSSTNWTEVTGLPALPQHRVVLVENYTDGDIEVAFGSTDYADFIVKQESDKMVSNTYGPQSTAPKIFAGPMYVRNITGTGGTVYIKTVVAGDFKTTRGITANISTGPLEFKQDGSTVQVSEDTGTPANSVPLPVKIIGSSNPPNSAGSYDEITNLTTSAQAFTVPANAVGFLLMAPSTNSQSIRFKVGAAAATGSGIILEPGRDTGYMPLAADVSVIATTGSNQSALIQWVLSQ